MQFNQSSVLGLGFRSGVPVEIGTSSRGLILARYVDAESDGVTVAHHPYSGASPITEKIPYDDIGTISPLERKETIESRYFKLTHLHKSR